MNKYEQIGAQELLSMLNDGELMSVKDTVTKSIIPANSVREKKTVFYSNLVFNISILFSVRKQLMLV
jgi:hypothetical protein